jgi:hypothetical protein
MVNSFESDDVFTSIGDLKAARKFKDTCYRADYRRSEVRLNRPPGIRGSRH